jgi:exonuclease III
MSQKNCSILCWNVRDLNDGAKRASVRNLILSSGATLVCLQETKIDNWNQQLVIEMVGQDMAANCAILPADGVSGGILLATSETFFQLQQIHAMENTVSARITMLEENISWCITGVYGPQTDPEKIAFMQEISDIKQHMEDRWLLLGDFNLIYRLEDKNNSRINIPMLNRFQKTIDDLQLAPLQLFGRKYTWTNEQQNPTMTKIDHLFASAEWLEIFPRTDLQALASMGSDHCPLSLQGDTSFEFYRGFRFEAYWVGMPGFMETVQHAWEQPVNTQNALLRMHVKLLRLARALKVWRRAHFSNWKIQMAIVQVVLLELEKAQERRSLTTEELEFRKLLKAKSVGMAAVQKAKARQHSRLTWIKDGDSNTRLFHILCKCKKEKEIYKCTEL